jgi:hypothetical protein
MEEMIFQAAEKVWIREEADDRFVIYFDERGYETNSVGATIIELCKNPHTLSELCQCLVEQFDSSLDEIVQDTKEIMQLFVKCGIIKTQKIKGERR